MEEATENIFLHMKLVEDTTLATFEDNYANNSNHSDNFFHYSVEDEYIFDRLDVRIIFVTLYTIVFSFCFFGNLLVILVVTVSRRLRSITNFFLANLAVADFCVGVFCVYQNLLIYLIPTWVLGDFLCKMYQFVHSLSYTASIFILVVICTERYFAIIHPITCKQILTTKRLRMVIGAVWITSAIYSAPKFFWVQTIVNQMYDGTTETICTTHRQKYNSKVFDVINFVLLYLVPLAVMSVLYTRIAVGLWKSSKELEKHLQASVQNQIMHSKSSTYQYYHHMCTHACQQNAVPPTNGTQYVQCRYKNQSVEMKPRLLTGGAMALTHPNSTQNVLRARRGVIRMLIVMVLVFAFCNLPFHARKMWQYWSSGYRGSSDFSTLFTPLTFLITYFNSGINPLLYAFLSRNFRRGMREIFLCSFRNSPLRRPPSQKFFSAHPNKEDILAEGQLNRNPSNRSMFKASSTTVTLMHNPNSDSYSNDV